MQDEPTFRFIVFSPTRLFCLPKVRRSGITVTRRPRWRVLFFRYVYIEVSWNKRGAVWSKIDDRGNRNGAKDRPEARPSSGGSGALHRSLRLSAQPRRASGYAGQSRGDSGDGAHRSEGRRSARGTGAYRGANGQDAEPALWVYRELPGDTRIRAHGHS